MCMKHSRSRRPGVEKTVTGIIELPERLNKGGRNPEELSVKSLTSTFYCNKIQCMQHMHVTHKSPILTIYVDLYGKVGLVGWLVGFSKTSIFFTKKVIQGATRASEAVVREPN